MGRRLSIARVVLGAACILATVGAVTTTDRAGATTSLPPVAAGEVLAAPSHQTGDLAAGSSARVQGTEGDGLRVRAEPSLDGALRATLIEGADVQVLEGPVAADGFRWYRVRYDSLGNTGWAAGQFLVAVSAPTTAGTAASTAPVPAAAAAAAPPSVAGAAANAGGGTPTGLALPAPGAGNTPSPPAVVIVSPALTADPGGAPPPAPGTDAATTTAGALAAAPGGTASAAGAGAAANTITTTPGRYVRLGAYQAANPEYGMNVFIWGEANTTQRDLGKLRELGFGWQKTLFQWREIEGQGKGIFDWREADRVIAASTAANVKVLARIDFPPSWAVAACDQRANECVPAQYEDYADFIRAFVTRYGTGSPIGRVQAIEVWNEPNLAREWGNAPINEAQARDYVRLLQLAYQAAKSVDPQMSIVSAGLTPTGTQNDEARPDDVYLQWIYDAGGAAYFDVLGAHGAGYKAPPTMSPDEVAADPSYGGHASFSFRRVEQLRKVMVDNGDDGKQVWLLEFGWTSDEVHPAYAWHRVTEDQKAQYIVDAYRWAGQNWTPWIGVMILWNLAAPGWSRDNEEYWWSITEPDGSPRAAYRRLLDARVNGQLP